MPHNSMIGGGVKAGLAADFKTVRLTADAEKIFYTNKEASVWRYEAAASVSLTKNCAVESSVLFEDAKHADIHEGRVGIIFHF